MSMAILKIFIIQNIRLLSLFKKPILLIKETVQTNRIKFPILTTILLGCIVDVTCLIYKNFFKISANNKREK